MGEVRQLPEEFELVAALPVLEHVVLESCRPAVRSVPPGNELGAGSIRFPGDRAIAEDGDRVAVSGKSPGDAKADRHGAATVPGGK
jgi:hypothetical protein